MAVCPICSSEVPASQASCPSCGALLDPGLPSGTTLAGHYRLDSQLGSGGFAITYRGLDTKLGRPVAIKELFPDGSTRQAATVMPSRTARSAWDQMVQSFSAEGRTLVDLENLALPGLVRVHDVFEANHTSYMVMELLQGQSLSEVIALAPGGRLPEARVLELARGLCRTLEAIHGRKILHRDLKPDNVMLVANRGPVLIDFGSARQFSAATAGMTTILTAGYAPLEQYSRQGRFGPPTDLYSLAATLYHAAVGVPPPAATDIVQGAPLPAPSAMVPGFSPAVSDALMAGLSIQARDRPQSAPDFMARITTRAPPAQPQPQRQAQQVSGTGPTPAWGQEPPPGSTAPYGTPPAAGYGAPQAVSTAGWLAPGDPPWRLALSRAAKRLIVFFLVLGAIIFVGYIIRVTVAPVNGTNSPANRAAALSQTKSAYGKLSRSMTAFESQEAACRASKQPLPCITAADKQASQTFGAYAQDIIGCS
jgi:serine/threonine protein kinase